MLKKLLIVGIAFQSTSLFAEECAGVPKFIGMYGEWESVAVSAEPAEILDQHPEWTVPHAIHGEPTEVCPGIKFVVRQVVGGEEVISQLNYVYDSSTNQSHGVITGSNGARLRGQVQHSDEQDLLTLYNFEGDVVWTETKVWNSDDEFLSAGVFDFDGEEGHVSFRTYRVTDTANSVPAVHRFDQNPIVVPAMLPGNDGENINGPSIIRAPAWLAEPLGKYYLYFAHHAGTYIRLAYADELAGPWKIYDPGTLQLENTVCNDITESSFADYRHVASPDVHVDDEAKQIRMYFHCPVYISGPKASNDSYSQVTLIATSADGLNFTAASEPLGTSYFRVFNWDGYHYALGMPGNIYRSKDGLTDFEKGPTLFNPDMRHSAVRVSDGKLQVLYTIVGENPERILYSEIALESDWMTWTETVPGVVLEPETDWEGGERPHIASERGFIMEPVRQLRDPAIYEEDGRSYLLYAVAGESGIAISEIHWR